jgi:hypothetical protein
MSRASGYQNARGMNASARTHRDGWEGVLLAGGFEAFSRASRTGFGLFGTVWFTGVVPSV